MASSSGVSCTKLVGNEVYALEYPDDYILRDSGYFVVRIQHLPYATIRLDAIDFLNGENHPSLREKPKAAHISRDVLTLFYTLPSDLCRGRYCEMISYFVGYLSVKYSSKNIRCNVTQFETKTQVSSFMLYHNHNLFLEWLMSLSPKITRTDVLEKTLYELEMMAMSEGVDLKKYGPSQKYGEILKISSGKVKSMPGFEDVRNEGKYLSFIYS